jgi:hypothetical protein
MDRSEDRGENYRELLPEEFAIVSGGRETDPYSGGGTSSGGRDCSAFGKRWADHFGGLAWAIRVCRSLNAAGV